MTTPDKIREAVKSVAQGYERLVLVVGPPGSGKSTAMRHAADEHAWDTINLSLSLGERLLEVPPHQRPSRTLGIVRSLIDEAESEVVCVDNIDLLFEPSLQVDPLGLLQSLSKEKTLVVAWPGRVTTDNVPRLVHAERPHPEYRQYPTQGLVLLSVPPA